MLNWIVRNHHHHHVVLVAQISLTLSRYFSLSFNASGRSSGLHPVSSHSCWMYVRAGRPAFARPCVGVHKRTSLIVRNRTDYLYKIDLALNNLQRLICHKPLTNQPTNQLTSLLVHGVIKSKLHTFKGNVYQFLKKKFLEQEEVQVDAL